MQIYLKFRGEHITLPMAVKYQTQSLIYRILAPDKDYTDFLHNSGYRVGNKTFKLITFGDFCGRYTVKNRMLDYGSRVTLQIRSPLSEFVSALLKNIRCGDEFELCGNRLILDDIHIEDRRVTASEIKVRTLSPITVYSTVNDKKTRYFSPNEPEFAEAIRSNALEKIKTLPISNKSEFTVIPLGEFTDKNKIVTQYKGLYINAWHGTFLLRGEPGLLDFLYNTGLGAKNSQGFGMFELM